MDAPPPRLPPSRLSSRPTCPTLKPAEGEVPGAASSRLPTPDVLRITYQSAWPKAPDAGGKQGSSMALHPGVGLR